MNQWNYESIVRIGQESMYHMYLVGRACAVQIPGIYYHHNCSRMPVTLLNMVGNTLGHGLIHRFRDF